MPLEPSADVRHARAPMDFERYIETIARSAPADWNVEDGPLFLPPGPDGAKHTFTMACRRDLSITMAYGMPSRAEVRADFAERFPDPRASMRYLDFFYNSALVFREVLMSVDGEQGILPVPNPGPTAPFEAPRRKCAVARLIHQLTNPMRDFEDYLAFVNMKPIDEFWPL
jgi:hypothetical protein